VDAVHVEAQAQLEKDGALRSRRLGARLGGFRRGHRCGTDDDEAAPEEAKAVKEKEIFMARETITIECTEARKEGKSPSRLHHQPQQEVAARKAGGQK